MQTTTLALLDRWKAARGLASDNAAANALGVTRAAISNYRRGKAHADVEIAAQMATDLGVDVLATLAAIEADRATREGARSIWRRFGRSAFMALAGLGLGMGVPPGGGVQARSSVDRPPMADIAGHYARRKKRHRGAAWAWLLPLRPYTAPCFAACPAL